MAHGGGVAEPSSTSRRTPWSPTVLTPLGLSDGLLELRSPRLADGPSWSAARLANQQWLERAFPAWGPDWAAEQREVDWAQRWGRLRRLALTGRAMPFVVRLDGELVGEIGIDAIDEVSGAGEASTWMVRDHGSPAVMAAASLLLLEHGFAEPHPMSRIVSPVTTRAREGRGPALRGLGFEIEAVVPRRVGTTGLVDHDLWVLRNTAESRRTVSAALAPMRRRTDPAARPALPAEPGRVALTTTLGRAGLREARAGARRARAVVADLRSDKSAGPPTTLPRAGSGEAMVLRPATRRDPGRGGGPRPMPRDATRWVLEVDGRAAAVIGHRHDDGTGTTEVFCSAAPSIAREDLSAGLEAVLDHLRPGPEEARVLLFRHPFTESTGPGPVPGVLDGLGWERIAAYRAPQARTDEWDGEDVWRARTAQ